MDFYLSLGPLSSSTESIIIHLFTEVCHHLDGWHWAQGNCYILLLFFVVLHHVLRDCCHCCSTSDGVFLFFCHYCSYNASSGPTSSFNLAGCGSATAADATGPKGCCWPHCCAAATASVPGAFSAVCQLCHVSFTGKFVFQSCASPWFVHKCWCLLWCLLSIFRFHCGCHFHLCGTQSLGFVSLQLLEHTHGRHMLGLTASAFFKHVLFYFFQDSVLFFVCKVLFMLFPSICGVF